METSPDPGIRMLARFAATFAWMWLGVALPFLTESSRSVEFAPFLFVGWFVITSIVCGTLGYIVALPNPPRTGFIIRMGCIAWTPLLLGVLLTFTEIGWLVREKLWE